MVYRLTSHVSQTHDLRWLAVAKFFKTPKVVNVELYIRPHSTHLWKYRQGNLFTDCNTTKLTLLPAKIPTRPLVVAIFNEVKIYNTFLRSLLSLLFITERITSSSARSWTARICFHSEGQLSRTLCLVRPQIMHDTMFDSLKKSAGIRCCCIGITTKPLVLPVGRRLKNVWCGVLVSEVKFSIGVKYALLKK